MSCSLACACSVRFSTQFLLIGQQKFYHTRSKTIFITRKCRTLWGTTFIKSQPFDTLVSLQVPALCIQKPQVFVPSCVQRLPSGKESLVTLAKFCTLYGSEKVVYVQ